MCLALRASGLWLRYAAQQNVIPSFPCIAPNALHPGAIRGKEGIKFCHLATVSGKALGYDKRLSLCEMRSWGKKSPNHASLRKQLSHIALLIHQPRSPTTRTTNAMSQVLCVFKRIFGQSNVNNRLTRKTVNYFLSPCMDVRVDGTNLLLHSMPDIWSKSVMWSIF